MRDPKTRHQMCINDHNFHSSQAGFNAGDKQESYSIAGAQTAGVLNLTFTSNVEIPGKWVFRVDSATIKNIDCELEGIYKNKPCLCLIHSHCFKVPISSQILGGIVSY